jgi:hydroxymethylbilane synthase
MTVRIGTRGSQLALYQANAVAGLLSERTQTECDIVIIKTSGDRLQDAALSEVGGKRLFVKEIEDALLAGTVDLAVHSSKDMPAVLPEGLDVAAVLPREDARDALVLPRTSQRLEPEAETLAAARAALGAAPRIGTSSVRRVAQLIALFPTATFLPIRGNLDTRLRKLDDGQFDAIVLASAGLRRLGFNDRISALVPADACVPAPGQGIIAVETRAADTRVRSIVERLNDAAAKAALDAERAVVRRLGGGCQMPIGAYASIDGPRMHLSASVISLDGSRTVRASVDGDVSAADALGVDAAERLLSQGAGDILAEVERAHGAVQGLQP